MRVCWKALACFGVAFWSLMCGVELFCGSILHESEFAAGLPEVSDEVRRGPPIYDSKFEVQQILVWSFVSFALAIGVCYLMNFVKMAMSKRVEPEYDIIQPVAQPSAMLTVTSSASKSKIPVLVTLLEGKKSKPLEGNEEAESIKPTILEAVRDFPVTVNLSSAESDPKESSSVNSDQRFAKAKEEMLDIQVNSWREHSTLVRKVDHLAKERKELLKQLAAAHKENKYTRQQLDDILADRAMLIKRLESATKEIKLNTATKQMTLEKLEEAFAFSNQMKEKMSLISREKDSLESKLRHLESQYRCLADRRSDNLQLANVTDEVLLGFPEPGKEIDVSQSEKDMQKVQNKLLDLERSLERMRLLSSSSNIEIEPKEEEEEEGERPTEGADSRHLEATGKASDVSTKADESDQMYNTCMAVIEYRESMTDSCISTNIDCSSTISLASDRSECRDDAAGPGMVSQSPAFQNFLLRILDQNKI